MALAEITLGPVLFHWPVDRWRDFYFRIADEAPVSTVYVGEAICSKRVPLFAAEIETVVARLKAAGKTVVFSTLSEVATDKDRQIVESVCSERGSLVEANDASALFHLQGRPHHVGPYVNVYNERTVAQLAHNGARNFCIPPEMPAPAIESLCGLTADQGITIETLVFGRAPLALSARCYHARAHGRTKDSCQFVCENDPDGLELRTIDGQPFLAVNGIQTLSYEYLNLVREALDLRAMGVSRFRLSPHTCDMVQVASIFRRALDRTITVNEAAADLTALDLPAPFCNGFYYGREGYTWTNAT
ncbi:MAG: U32 family peptidase [Micropepsaceae bacterium]